MIVKFYTYNLLNTLYSTSHYFNHQYNCSLIKIKIMQTQCSQK